MSAIIVNYLIFIFVMYHSTIQDFGLTFSSISFVLINHRKFEDTKVVIRSRKPKRNKHYNGQDKTDKMINNDMQNTTQKAKDRETQTP